MPLYIYRCPNKHEISVVHGMLAIVKQFCPVCGAEMWKKPQVHAVKWGCFIEPSPAIKRHLDTAQQQRDEYEERKHATG